SRRARRAAPVSISSWPSASEAGRGSFRRAQLRIVVRRYRALERDVAVLDPDLHAGAAQYRARLGDGHRVGAFDQVRARVRDELLGLDLERRDAGFRLAL